MTGRITSLLLLAALATSCTALDATPPGQAVGAAALAAPIPTPSATSTTTSPTFGSDPVPAGAFLFYEDFERGYDRWALPDASAAVTFRKLNAPTCGGLWSILLGTADHARYTPAPGEHVLALKAPLDLSKAKKPFLKYDVKGVTFPAEAVELWAEIRGAGGAWTPVGRRVRGGYVFMASIGADLTAWAGQPIDLRFRARMTTGTEGAKGMYLDDVQVVEPS